MQRLKHTPKKTTMNDKELHAVDRNGMQLKKGDHVIWYDPDTEHQDLTRIYTIDEIRGEDDDDIILISDDYSETEVWASELALYDNQNRKNGLSELQHMQGTCRDMMENALLQFVKEHGVDLTSYEINEFGLDEGREGEDNITKVWNFFDNGGCYFIEANGINNDQCIGISDKNWHESLNYAVTYNAYQCLYIVVDDNGNERLKYYRFSNGGCAFDDDQAEPDHDYVSKLSLVDLSYIIAAIEQNTEQP